MKKNTLRVTWWAAIFLYVSFIYATLGTGPVIWNWLSSFSGDKNTLVLYSIYSATGAAFLFYIIFVKKEKSILNYLFLILLFYIYYSILEYAQYPREKIHIGEYSLLGIMVYNAMKIEFDRFNPKLYLYAALICMVIGAVDEVIQKILPNRVFDWRDIFMNGVSSVLVLLAVRVNVLRRQ